MPPGHPEPRDVDRLRSSGRPAGQAVRERRRVWNANGQDCPISMEVAIEGR